jgi:hypothetical protein
MVSKAPKNPILFFVPDCLKESQEFPLDPGHPPEYIIKKSGAPQSHRDKTPLFPAVCEPFFSYQHEWIGTSAAPLLNS